MKYCAKVVDGVVDSVLVGDPSWAEKQYGGFWVATNKKVGLQWTWSEQDGFRPKQPYTSWVYSDQQEKWIAPTPYPQDGNIYQWNDDSFSWIKV